MTAFDDVDFFTDRSLVADPYPYFEYLRNRCPVAALPHHGVVAVTGYDEMIDVLRDTDTFSSCNAVTGPFPGLPVRPEGDNVDDLIAQHRHMMPMSEYLITKDGTDHAERRSLLKRLLTPNRMRENEEAIWPLADAQIDEFIDRGRFEVIGDYARPFAILVIADLLGVPEEDRSEFRRQLSTIDLPEVKGRNGQAHKQKREPRRDPLAFLFEKVTGYVESRRRNPQPDVLTALANATYPDGRTPAVADVVRTASFLFAAGGDTTTRLLAAAMRIIAEQPDVAELLRSRRDMLPNFIDEVLRIESPVKSAFRLARKSTTVGGVDIAAGTVVMLPLGAANRDPRRYDRPDEFRADRPNAQTHLSFGRGVHTCPGGPLSRTEVRISLERLLNRICDFRVSTIHHGPPDARRFVYEPTYILRGHTALHLDFTPAARA